MRFKEFHEVDICKPEAILAIASFFCPKKCRLPLTLIGDFIISGIHMTAITHIGLAVPDLDAVINWYEQVLD
ncbi:hypothetical protein [Peribacillus frigoritolerans]|uniref:hypothetical protein n=1 Tax=Peribacillus frigoritolerans TaxID=450367 RepID=UPI001F4FE45D|nr:hypothetical protein [Peribacillus frigoritolerans]MCK2016895.1 hypothetical protein [Peribacillus frigoritolerans]